MGREVVGFEVGPSRRGFLFTGGIRTRKQTPEGGTFHPVSAAKRRGWQPP